MTEESKAMSIARILDAYRAVPRTLVLLYGLVCYQIAVWFMGLSDPSMAQGSFVSVIWGAAAAWFGLYCKTGWNWSK